MLTLARKYSLRRVFQCSRTSQIGLFSTKTSKSKATKLDPENAQDAYERKTPHEHVLLRPGMYIGQIEPSTIDTWVFNESTQHMEKRSIHYSPALLKIFDEIIVNAADNFQRDDSMTSIDISITSSPTHRLLISVKNDGKSIPVVLHAREGIYLPQLIFGNLLTGSNFNDTQQLYTGGRHGYGAKLTNIFSTFFSVESLDMVERKVYRQRWERNMFLCHEPTIEAVEGGKKGKGSSTKITFAPDLEKFGYGETEKGSGGVGGSGGNLNLGDVILIMKRRALDIAACLCRGASPLVVTLNGEPVPIRSFEDYSLLFSSPTSTHTPTHTHTPPSTPPSTSTPTSTPPSSTVFHTKINPRWEVSILPSPSLSFEQLSFVNGIWTSRGGSHALMVTNQVVSAVEAEVLKHGLTAPHALIRSKLMIILRCEVPNPSFDSQSKDSLTTSTAAILFSYSSSSGSGGGSSMAPFTLSPTFLKRFIAQSGVVESVVQDLEVREHNKLSKATARTSKVCSV